MAAGMATSTWLDLKSFKLITGLLLHGLACCSPAGPACPSSLPFQPALPACRACLGLAHSPAYLPACWCACLQGFLQFAPKSAVGKLVKGALGAADYSSPRPTPATKGGAAGGPRIVAYSSITFQPQR